jgi:hypothetical protein
VVRNFVLKKKRECERNEEGAPMRGIDRSATPMLVP